MSRKVVRKLAVVAIIIGTLISPITMKPLFHGFGGTKEVIIAKGVIDNKRSIDYECGTSKSRQTCTDYMFSIDNKEHPVTPETFYKYTEQQNITLVETESNRSPYWWEQLFILYSAISSVITGTYLSGIFLMFLYWLFFSDSKRAFKDWVIN